MSKLVIDVKLKQFPKNDDIIVYDEKSKCWNEISKEQFLHEFKKETDVELSKLEQEISSLRKLIEANTKNIIAIAKILKD